MKYFYYFLLFLYISTAFLRAAETTDAHSMQIKYNSYAQTIHASVELSEDNGLLHVQKNIVTGICVAWKDIWYNKPGSKVPYYKRRNDTPYFEAAPLLNAIKLYETQHFSIETELYS